MVFTDCIDSCIILGTAFEEDDKCKMYMNTVGYKMHNTGILTMPLIGEVFTNLFLKAISKVTDDFVSRNLLETMLDFFDGSITTLFRDGKLDILPFESSDVQHIQRLKEIDYSLTDDDALHLSTAINKKCQRFITTDGVLLREEFKARIRKEFRLVISSPS